MKKKNCYFQKMKINLLKNNKFTETEKDNFSLKKNVNK